MDAHEDPTRLPGDVSDADAGGPVPEEDAREAQSEDPTSPERGFGDGEAATETPGRGPAGGSGGDAESG